MVTNNIGALRAYYSPVSMGTNQRNIYGPVPIGVPQEPQPPVAPPKKKTGFFEGVKAFFKGIVRPIKNMIKHPIKTALFALGAAALIIGTGGAATPLLVAAGATFGGFQLVKGTYNAITSDTREQTLAALEDMGEGTFTIGASLAGAKSYASSTSAGSATVAAADKATLGAKILAYSKGLVQDTATVFKAVPNSARTSWAMLKSGELAGNLHSVAMNSKLSLQRKGVEMLQEQGSSKAAAAQQNYAAASEAFKQSSAARQESVFNRYVDMSYKNNSPLIQERALSLIENGFSNRTIGSHINLVKNLPEENLAIALSSQYGGNDQDFSQDLYTYGPTVGINV